LIKFGNVIFAEMKRIAAVLANELNNIFIAGGRYVPRNRVVGLKDESTPLGSVQFCEDRGL
jgi:hypothetical protein